MLAKDEQRGRQDILFVEERLVVEQHGDSPLDHFYGARSCRAGDTEVPSVVRDAARPPKSRRFPRACGAASARRTIPNRFIGRVTLDQPTRPFENQPIERVVGTEVDDLFRRVLEEQQARSPFETRKVAVRWAEDPEPHPPRLAAPSESAVLSSSPWPAASPPSAPVEITLDGETLVAEQGEALAFALLAADKLALSRSPKLHRPRGPSCLRGACDGCLVRVDGRPNVMTCMTPCHGGERLETQMCWGRVRVDLLQVTDWFFPRGSTTIICWRASPQLRS